MWGEVDRMRCGMDKPMGLWESGAIRPKIARAFKFDEAPAAHYSSGPRNIGKVLRAP
jgi:NADPH:quinone reductase-like Zn-dependent oxidoreductase